MTYVSYIRPVPGVSSLHEGEDLDKQKTKEEAAMIRRFTKEIKQKVSFSWSMASHGSIITQAKLEAKVHILSDTELQVLLNKTRSEARTAERDNLRQRVMVNLFREDIQIR